MISRFQNDPFAASDPFSGAFGGQSKGKTLFTVWTGTRIMSQNNCYYTRSNKRYRAVLSLRLSVSPLRFLCAKHSLEF